MAFCDQKIDFKYKNGADVGSLLLLLRIFLYWAQLQVVNTAGKKSVPMQYDFGCSRVSFLASNGIFDVSDIVYVSSLSIQNIPQDSIVYVS